MRAIMVMFDSINRHMLPPTAASGPTCRTCSVWPAAPCSLRTTMSAAYPACPPAASCCTLRIPAQRWPGSHPYETLLFDLHKDPKQESPMDDRDIDPAVKQAMIEHLVRLMKENDAPKEQFARLGLLDQDQL